MTRSAGLVVLAVGIVLLAIAVVALWLASEAAADMPALRDEVDRLRGEIAAVIAREPAESPVEPRTEPIGLPVPEPTTQRTQALTGRTDTEPIAAAIDRGLEELQPATTGRHRA